MSTVILACQTVADELNLAIDQTGVTYPVYWIESGLHNTPERLRGKIQEELGDISELTGASTILLVFGYCGSSLQGVSSASSRLILPRVDDCIALLLGSSKKRQNVAEEKTTYFFTAGWLKHERSLVQEYEYALEKYGRERALELMEMMLKHYERFLLINTGAYDLTPYLEQVKELASLLGLECQVLGGSLRLFRKLLTGPWDEEFIVTPPGEKVVLDYMTCRSGDALQGR